MTGEVMHENDGVLVDIFVWDFCSCDAEDVALLRGGLHHFALETKKHTHEHISIIINNGNDKSNRATTIKSTMRHIISTNNTSFRPWHHHHHRPPHQHIIIIIIMAFLGLVLRRCEESLPQEVKALFFRWARSRRPGNVDTRFPSVQLFCLVF